MTRILISDDHAVLRTGVREIVMKGFKGAMCGEAANAADVVAQVQKEKWDLVILDLSMPGRSGIDLLNDLKRMQPKLPVLVLSMHPEDQYGKRMLRSGAAGYMNKDVAPLELIRAIHKVLAGGRYISASLAERLALEVDTEQPPHNMLSEREFEVLRLIASGKTVSEIAETIHLSIATVSTYRARILLKLNVKNTAELIRYGLEHHLAD